jgi:hypothetical protein
MSEYLLVGVSGATLTILADDFADLWVLASESHHHPRHRFKRHEAILFAKSH